MPFKNLSEPENLGVITQKHESGIRETNLGHKSMSGSLGDTLMRGVDRKCYVTAKAVRNKTSKSKDVDMASPEVLAGTGIDSDGDAE